MILRTHIVDRSTDFGVETFDREIPAALSSTKALEDSVDNPISKRWVSTRMIKSYIRHRALVEGRSSPNIYRYLNRVLDEVTGLPGLHCPIRLKAMDKLIDVILQSDRRSQNIQTLLDSDSVVELDEQTFLTDCLQASVVLGKTKMLDIDRIRDELSARASCVLVNDIKSLFQNSLICHATIAGNEKLLSELLDMRRTLGTLSKQIINLEDEIVSAVKLSIYHQHEGITTKLMALMPFSKPATDELSLYMPEDLAVWVSIPNAKRGF